jgi:hypothetical protein
MGMINSVLGPLDTKSLGFMIMHNMSYAGDH